MERVLGFVTSGELRLAGSDREAHRAPSDELIGSKTSRVIIVWALGAGDKYRSKNRGVGVIKKSGGASNFIQFA
jgi:hypothetical protein